MAVGKQETSSTWRGALEAAVAGARALPGGYIVKPKESLGQPGLDRIFVDRCRAAFGNLNRLLGAGVIAVVSPHRAEGRSSVAAGLALALAQDMERQVLLVDLDLRQPGQGLLFDVPDHPGLSEYMSDAPLRLVGGGPGRRLWLLAAGATEPTEVARLTHQLARGEFFAACRQAFSWTVVDVPPLLETPEGAYLAGLADACLLVGRYRRTSIHALSRASALIPAERPTAFLMSGNSSRVPTWINRLL
jgi:Mrp family chromosome partitioning ATPase